MQQYGKRVSLDHLFEKSPSDTKRVTRSSRWGNPFKISNKLTREESIRKYETYLKEKLKEEPDFLIPLRDKKLACFCNINEPCHVDILLKYIEQLQN